ncbi:MAG: SRPBCC family protein [Solirubrobacterales bacterium]|nr:SRPBCC family protein [Solirubrobacterales bacterium]
MAEVERSKRFDVTAQQMWGRIGDFQGVAAWHPGIARCTPQEDGEVRELALPDGAKVVERRVAQTDSSYTYRILDPGPLPVSDYEATIAVRDGEGGGSVVDWRATFTPAGASEADAIEVIEGVFDGGLDAL